MLWLNSAISSSLTWYIIKTGNQLYRTLPLGKKGRDIKYPFSCYQPPNEIRAQSKKFKKLHIYVHTCIPMYLYIYVSICAYMFMCAIDMSKSWYKIYLYRLLFPKNRGTEKVCNLCSFPCKYCLTNLIQDSSEQPSINPTTCQVKEWHTSPIF
jgi:hypothetical protein